jgi:DNA invertase Pin-like site-specific DNA recombinase
MVFTVLGAVAELERSLIAERVKAGLRNARAKGIRLGRPRVYVNATTVATLRHYLTASHDPRQRGYHLTLWLFPTKYWQSSRPK